MTAFTLGVMARSTISAVISPVTGSTSTKRGVAPAMLTASAVAMNVLPGTITSWPAPMPSARSDIASASVPEARPTASSASQ
jgi:hypothetical protein